MAIIIYVQKLGIMLLDPARTFVCWLSTYQGACSNRHHHHHHSYNFIIRMHTDTHIYTLLSFFSRFFFTKSCFFVMIFLIFFISFSKIYLRKN